MAGFEFDLCSLELAFTGQMFLSPSFFAGNLAASRVLVVYRLG